MDKYTDLHSRSVSYALHGKVMLCTAILLFITLFIILCFHNSARFFYSRRRRRYIRRRRAQHLLSLSTAITSPTSTASSRGLDPSVIKTIPTFIYSDKTKAGHFAQVDCAVCLSEFVNDDEARVLPICNHAFHVDCIDVWFHSHSNCPLCRAPVQAQLPVDSTKTLEHTVVVQVNEPAGSYPPSDQDIEMNIPSATAASSSSTSSSLMKMESCPMKRLELVGVWNSCGDSHR